MSAVVAVALVLVAVVLTASVVALVIIVRDALPSRKKWAQEDLAAGEDPRRDVAAKDFWAGGLDF